MDFLDPQPNTHKNVACTVYGVNYSIHGIRSHDSDLALYALRNRETTGSLGTGIVYRYCSPWVSPGLKGQ
jgi:hypothetical protein